MRYKEPGFFGVPKSSFSRYMQIFPEITVRCVVVGWLAGWLLAVRGQAVGVFLSRFRIRSWVVVFPHCVLIPLPLCFPCGPAVARSRASTL